MKWLSPPCRRRVRRLGHARVDLRVGLGWEGEAGTEQNKAGLNL